MRTVVLRGLRAVGVDIAETELVRPSWQAQGVTMARSDLLISLVKAGVSGDTRTVKRTVEAIVAEERAKQHNVLADRLEKVVESAAHERPIKYRPRPCRTYGPGRAKFIAEITPRRRLDELVLP